MARIEKPPKAAGRRTHPELGTGARLVRRLDLARDPRARARGRPQALPAERRPRRAAVLQGGATSPRSWLSPTPRRRGARMDGEVRAFHNIFEEEDEHLPERVGLQPRAGGEVLHERAPRQRPLTTAASTPERPSLGADEREVGGQQRHRDLDQGRRRCGSAAGARQLMASPSAAPPVPTSRKSVRRVAERERAGHRGRYRGAVEHERGAVVDEALALDERHHALRHAEPPEDAVAATVFAAETIAPSTNAAPSGQAGDDRVGDDRDGGGRQDEHAGQQRHAGRVGAQVARRGQPARGVRRRRQGRRGRSTSGSTTISDTPGR